MVNEEILAALKMAVSKGDSLNKAMMSLYNAGYPKSDIEEAARQIQAPQVSENFAINARSSKLYSPTSHLEAEEVVSEDNPSSKPKFSSGPNSEIKPDQQTQTPTPSEIMKKFPSIQKPLETIQKVSNYDGKQQKQVSKGLIFVLVFFLLFLIGILVGVFLFRDQLTALFNGLS